MSNDKGKYELGSRKRVARVLPYINVIMIQI